MKTDCYVVAYGSPTEGFRLHGPFPTEKAAGDWGEFMGEGGEYVMPVRPVDDDSCMHLYNGPSTRRQGWLKLLRDARPLPGDVDYEDELRVDAENLLYAETQRLHPAIFTDGWYESWHNANTTERVDAIADMLRRHDII